MHYGVWEFIEDPEPDGSEKGRDKLLKTKQKKNTHMTLRKQFL